MPDQGAAAEEESSDADGRLAPIPALTVGDFIALLYARGWVERESPRHWRLPCFWLEPNWHGGDGGLGGTVILWGHLDTLLEPASARILLWEIERWEQARREASQGLGDEDHAEEKGA